MAKSNFTKLGTADSVLSAHLNGLGDAINKVESVLGMKTASKQDYALTPVADQDDVSLQYRIYECNITNWVSEPAPVIYKNGIVVDPVEYVLYPGHGAVVFHIQQQPADIVTADFEHIVPTSQRLSTIEEDVEDLAEQVETNTQDIEELKEGGGGGSAKLLHFPIYTPGVYRNAALFGEGASYRGGDNGGIQQSAYDLIVVPLYIPEEITFDRIGTNVINSGGGFLRYGIWKDNNGYPGELYHSAQVAAATGLRMSSAEYTLEPGTYWIGYHSDGTHRCNGMRTNTLPVIGTDWNPAKSYVAYRVSVIWGSSLPDPFPSGASRWAVEDHEALAAVFIRRKA